ncbi:MAG: PilZ domain-containing protein [Oligoflexales bacterium]
MIFFLEFLILLHRSQRIDVSVDVVITNDSGQLIYDFFSLNISNTGMLIASQSVVKDEIIRPRMVIDPLQNQLSSSLICDIKIVRTENEDSKYSQKYALKKLGVGTVFGVHFDFISFRDWQTLRYFLNSSSSLSVAN